MNHTQVLMEVEKQSKQAQEDVKQIIDSNMNQLASGLRNQTKNEISVFQRNLRSTLKRAHSDYSKAIKQKQIMIWIPFFLSCLLLGGVASWFQYSMETFQKQVAMNSFQTIQHQNKTYAIIPPMKVLETPDGNFLIQLD